MTEHHVIRLIQDEAREARQKYGPFHSTHEVYGVLKEELDEFFESVRANKSDYKELIQIAAIAKRAAMELKTGEIKWH